MIRRIVNMLLAVVCLGLVLPSAAQATSPEYPTVFEDLDLGIPDPGYPKVEYTVTNPEDSYVGDIVGLVIDYDPVVFSYAWVDTANGWEYQNLTASNWTSTMPYCDLTWEEFYGGMDYPYGDGPAAGYFVAYSSSPPDGYRFDDPDLAISPGESLGQFFVIGAALSTYYLAYIDDAPGDTFDPDGLPWVTGEAVPEPSALVLLVTGAAWLLAFVRRRRCR